MRSYVICVRDPDYANEYTYVQGDDPGVVGVIDLDLGRDDPSSYDRLWALYRLEDIADEPLEVRRALLGVLKGLIEDKEKIPRCPTCHAGARELERGRWGSGIAYCSFGHEWPVE